MIKKLAELFLSVLMILSLSAPAWGQLSDTDSDGVIDEIDNCAQVINLSQTDTDADDLGDACDADDDDDDIPDAQDSYPLDSSR